MIHEREVSVAADHPAFAGHFPGRPILPGVVLLGWAVQTLGEVLGDPLPACEIASAKFLRPVGPGTKLSIRLAGQPGGPWRFDILDGDWPVATGSLRASQA
ncbi:3-hydroxylacyl-ACP dehydratase [Aromatoleum sp.]|uniref:3-hydroxylacyl-ACP dehydratase n=1 Tax=Aromatoleum sp. TaxID=2307007 RepID=UPI002FC61388